jgi:hypothetical protein
LLKRVFGHEIFRFLEGIEHPVPATESSDPNGADREDVKGAIREIKAKHQSVNSVFDLGNFQKSSAKPDVPGGHAWLSQR